MEWRIGLSWAEARELLRSGSYARRELWDDKRLFATSGGLVWVDTTPPRVVQASDFGREEFLAKDWTDMAWEQRDCVDHPGWTHFFIDETDVVTLMQPVSQSYAADSDVRETPTPFDFGLREITNPLPVAATVQISGRVDDYLLIDGQVAATTFGGVFSPFGFRLAAGGKFTIAARNRSPFYLSDWVGYAVQVVFTPESQAVTNLVRLERSYPNPFAAACHVAITGSASDALLLNGREVALPVAFALAEGGTFSLAALVRNPAAQPAARLDLEVTMTL